MSKTPYGVPRGAFSIDRDSQAAFRGELSQDLQIEHLWAELRSQVCITRAGYRGDDREMIVRWRWAGLS